MRRLLRPEPPDQTAPEALELQLDAIPVTSAPRLRVVGYCRCSSQDQADAVSLDAQRAKIQAWADVTDADVVEWVEDAAISGTMPLAKRPAGARIGELMSMRKPLADAVVVVRLDRLGRDAAETLALLRSFAKGPVGLVSISDRLDLTTPQGRAMAGIACVFGELERELIAARTAEALAALRSQGRVYGTIPFGYVERDGYLVEDPGEQTVLRRARALRAKGLSYGAIADRLNSAGIPAKRGGQWWAMTARSVLATSSQLGG